MKRLRGAAALSVLVLAAQPCLAQPGLPPSPPPAPKKPPPTVEAPTGIPAGALRERTPLSLLFVLANTAAGGSSIRRVELREEAAEAEYFARYGGGSLRATIDVDCDSREFQLDSFSLFERNNLSGATVSSVSRRTTWQAPGAGTVLARGIDMACRSAPASAARRTVATAATAAPRSAPAPERPAVSPAPGRDLRPAQSAGGYAGAVQVGASGSAEAARAALDALARQEPELLAGVVSRVEAAQVRGATVFRSLLSGFGGRAEAVAFCQALARRGRACFVRG